MERLAAKVPPPLNDRVDDFKKRHGYETRAQAIRALLRRGLDNE